MNLFGKAPGSLQRLYEHLLLILNVDNMFSLLLDL